MSKGRRIVGIIFLGVAAHLRVLYLTLLAQRMVLQVGSESISWVPVVILGVGGPGLSASPGTSRQRS